MKKMLPFIIAVFAVSKLAAQSIPNGGFENWNSTVWNDPKNYTTSNDQLIHVPGASPNVVQVAGWTAGYNGAQMTTEAINGDTMPGYINNAINNPLSGEGGVAYNQKPAQLEIWYNCNEMTGDSGGIVVVFKNSGSIIGSYLFSVTGIHSGYPIATFPITALSGTPDTVILAATSSINVLRGKNGFAGSTFTISGIEFENSGNGVINPAEINDSLLNWTGQTVLTPVSWEDLYPETFRTDTAHTGSYAVELKTLADVFNSGAPTQGEVTTGYFNSSTYGVGGGQPYNNTNLIDTLNFYYIYSEADGVDSGFVEEDFINEGQTTLNVGSDLLPANTFTHGVLYDTLTSKADSVIVTFYSSNYYNPPQNSIGNHLIVDDVSFSSQTTGIKPVLMDNNKILIYPNPASTQLTIASAQAEVNEVKLISIMGQTILDKQYADGVAADHESIDISKLPAGMYFISVTSGGETTTGKISVINK